MRERGILMSGPMVRAILAGRKTQTRRAVKLPGAGGQGPLYRVTRKPDGRWSDSSCLPFRCPYDAPSLWVRETWGLDCQFDDDRPVYRADHAQCSEQNQNRCFCRMQAWRPSLLMPRKYARTTLAVESIRVERAQAISDADIAAEGVDAEAVDALWAAAKQSRRAELWPFAREALADRGPPADWRAIDNWRAAWTLINGRESWDANPWVWVVSFRRTP